MTERRTLTIAEAAGELGISVRHAYHLAARGELPGCRGCESRTPRRPLDPHAVGRAGPPRLSRVRVRDERRRTPLGPVDVREVRVTVLDLFAGPGGWDEGLRELGIRPLGIELDTAACETRRAARHETLQADVAALDPSGFAPCGGLIGSPPCPTFSAAGRGAGHAVVDVILSCGRDMLRGVESRAEHRERAFSELIGAMDEPSDKDLARARRDADMSMLVLEPLRWALALRPRWIALEQVPPVLGLWRWMAHELRTLGYSAWVGVLNAADYGVPQTRERAFLMASLDGPVHPPAPTHCKGGAVTLAGELLPWVSMAKALGWNGALEHPRGARMVERHGPRAPKATDDVAMTVTGKARSWIVRTNNFADKDGRRSKETSVPYERAIDEPAPTLDCRVGGWMVAAGRTGEGRPKDASTEPADTLSGKGTAYWIEDEGEWRKDESQAVRVTVREAAILQGFRPDYQWQGSRTKQFQQVGNAVPPPLAQAVVSALAHVRARQAA